MRIRLYQKFTDTPYMDDRLLCGINALIEVLDLPLEKLKSTDRLKTAQKLKELSKYDSHLYMSLISQCVKLQILIEILCNDNDQIMEKVFTVCEEKLKYFFKTGEYI